MSDRRPDLLRVFVYGTLKPGEANYDRYCAEKVVAQQAAIVWGTLYDLPLGYPALTIGTLPVQGFILSFRDPQVLQELDELEDFDPNRSPEHNEYLRQPIEAFDPATQTSLGQVWGYVMTPERAIAMGGILLTSGWWTEKNPKI